MSLNYGSIPGIEGWLVTEYGIELCLIIGRAPGDRLRIRHRQPRVLPWTTRVFLVSASLVHPDPAAGLAHHHRLYPAAAAERLNRARLARQQQKEVV